MTHQKVPRTPGRRRADARAEIAIVLSLIAVLVVVVGAGYTARSVRNSERNTTALKAAQADLLTIKEGRRLGVVTTCSINVAVIGAGQDVFRSSALLPGDKLRDGRFIPGPLTNLLGSAFPSYPERVERAEDNAAAYEAKITRSIEQALKRAGQDRVPVENGRLSCEKLAVTLRAR